MLTTLTLFASLSFAAKPHVLTLEVVADEETPVGAATVMHTKEQERHRVHDETGRWTASVLYMEDGTEQILAKNQVHDLIVTAPGYELTMVRVALSGKSTTVKVVLPSWDVTSISDGSELANKAIAHHKAWAEAEHAAMDATSEAAMAARYGAANKAADAAREWLDATSSAEAWALCKFTGSAKLCGDEPK